MGIYKQIDFQLIDGPVQKTHMNVLAVDRSENVGATAQFIGTVRADFKNDDVVSAIEFTTDSEIAEMQCIGMLEKYSGIYNLHKAIVLHSIGHIKAGEICFVVHVESGHRKEAFSALEDITNAFKSAVPIFGREILKNGKYVWKENV